MTLSDSGSWADLAGRADAGELSLEPGVARACAARCTEMIESLDRLRADARGLTTVDGFGDRLATGVALAAKFGRKASGGDYALDRAIGDHMRAVEQMRTVFETIESRYAAAEEANATAATAVESQIN